MSDGPSFVVTALAEADVDEHQEWYLRERADRPDLLDRYGVALRRVLELIERNPEALAPDSLGVRHARLRGVPYTAHFTVTASAVVIVAVLHEKQDPQTWRRRV